MAAGDLTTLDNVKQWIPTTVTTDDALLTRLITAVSTFVQSWLNRTIALQAYTEVRNGQGGAVLCLQNFPIASVASLTVDGVAISPRPALGPGTYAGQPGGYTFDDSSVFLTGWRFCRGFQNVAVAYTAGYATTPADIEQAVIDTIALWFKNNRGDRLGVNSMAIEQQTISFKQFALSSAALLTLQQYKKVAIIQ